MDFKKINLTILKVFIIGTIIIAIILMAIDIRGFKNTVLSFNYRYVPLILMLIVLNYTFRFIKWNFYLKQANIGIPIKDSANIFLSALPMTITPGKVGELLKAYLLKTKHNYPISTTTPLVIIERLTDALGMLLLAGIGALAFNYGIGVLIIVLILIVLGLVIIQSKKLCYGFINMITRIPLIKKYAPSLIDFYESTCSLLKIRILTVAIIIGITAWIVEGFIIYFIAKGAGINISLFYSIFILAMSSIIGVISMLPGGIVASEGSILALLIKVGVQKGQAGYVVLLVRVATLWLGVAVGSIKLLKTERNLAKSGYKDFKIEDGEIIGISGDDNSIV